MAWPTLAHVTRQWFRPGQVGGGGTFLFFFSPSLPLWHSDLQSAKHSGCWLHSKREGFNCGLLISRVMERCCSYIAPVLLFSPPFQLANNENNGRSDEAIDCNCWAYWKSSYPIWLRHCERWSNIQRTIRGQKLHAQVWSHQDSLLWTKQKSGFEVCLHLSYHPQHSTQKNEQKKVVY